MAKTIIIAQDLDQTYEIQKSGWTYLFEDEHTFSSSTGSAIALGANRKFTAVIEGYVENAPPLFVAAISSTGSNATVVVAETGVVSGGNIGIQLNGYHGEISNHGLIQGGPFGVMGGGAEFYIDNSGDIRGAVGINLSGDLATATNQAGATIVGTATAVNMTGLDGMDMWFNNHGYASGNTVVRGGAERDIVWNDGIMSGLVTLGGGNDIFDNRGGKLTTLFVDGNTGNDTLIVDNAKYTLHEMAGEGYDTVKSTVSYRLSDNVERLILLGAGDTKGFGNAGDNSLRGNAGDNTLFGLSGKDVLDGGHGNDILTGGGGKDTFVFSSHYDMDRITDFTSGFDTIDLRGWKDVSSFSSMMKHAENHGDDLWIISGDDMLIVEDHHKADMQKADFLF